MFWTTPLKSSDKRKKKNETEKAPAAISSDSFRNFLRQKEQKKVKEEKEKEKRKAERLKRREHIEKQKQKRKKRGRKVENSELSQVEKKSNVKIKEKCANCNLEMESDKEDNDLKNLGCDKCPKWYHLKYTPYASCIYEEIANKNFICSFCV